MSLLPKSLVCYFTGTIVEKEDTYQIEVPKTEVENGGLDLDETHRVAIFAVEDEESSSGYGLSDSFPEAVPVEYGEVRRVEIEDLTSSGEGIARIERGYVLIAPDVDVGDRVKVEVGKMHENYAEVSVVESA